MAKTATYHTDVEWRGAHRATSSWATARRWRSPRPPDAHGQAGVLTPEDAFVAAANTCIMMMFLWACERFKIDLVDYRCRAEGTKKIELDRTEIFTELRFRPQITVRADAAAKREHGAPGAQGTRGRAEVQPCRELSEERDHRRAEIVIQQPAGTLHCGDGARRISGKCSSCAPATRAAARWLKPS